MLQTQTQTIFTQPQSTSIPAMPSSVPVSAPALPVATPVAKKPIDFKFDNEKQEVPKLNVNSLTKNASTKANDGNFWRYFDKCTQSGYQSKNDYETQIIGQDRKYAVMTSEKQHAFKTGGTVIKSETLNKFKRTYRAGYQNEASDYSSLSSHDKLLLMGVREPELIRNKGLRGDTSANGHNGWVRQKLLMSTYTDIAGNNV